MITGLPVGVKSSVGVDAHGFGCLASSDFQMKPNRPASDDGWRLHSGWMQEWPSPPARWMQKYGRFDPLSVFLNYTEVTADRIHSTISSRASAGSPSILRHRSRSPWPKSPPVCSSIGMPPTPRPDFRKPETEKPAAQSYFVEIGSALASHHCRAYRIGATTSNARFISLAAIRLPAIRLKMASVASSSIR